MLISTPIPNLIGGVNQQPPSIRAANEADVVDNAVPSPVEGLTKRPPTEHLAAVSNGTNLRQIAKDETLFVHLIERDEAEKYLLIVQENGTADVYDLAGTRKTLFIDGATTLGSAVRSKRKALTIGDVTFISNGNTLPAALTGAGNTVTQTPTNYNRAGLVWIRQANYDRSHTIKITTATTPTPTIDTFTHSMGNSGDAGTDHAATSLFNGSGGAGSYSGPAGGIVARTNYGGTTKVDNVIYIVNSATNFTVVVEDDFGGEGMVFIRDKIERLEDLPPTAPHDYMVQVVGTPESEFDDYWVQFKADDGVFSRGVWQECPAPGSLYKWDKSKMPILLIRQSDGTFMLKQADGTTPSVANGRPTGSSATLYDGYKWTDRLVGSDTTNPFPSFTGLGIQDMVFHQNRLGFMAGENIIFSETSEFFNFFRTTVLDVLDSDPIDVASSNPRVGKIVSALPFNRDLILFTPTSQMILRGGEILSPKQVAIISVAEFDSQAATVEPIPSASAVFFTFSNGGFTGMRELVPQPALDGSYLANDLTINAARYIPGTAVHIAASTNDNLAVVVGGDGNLYCYKYYDQGGARVQSAWFRFTFLDSSSFGTNPPKAVWAGFVESDLYVVFKRAKSATHSYYTIEKVRMGVGVDDFLISGKSWLTHIDQRTFVDASVAPGTYSSATGLTTFNLPKPMSYIAGRTKVVTDTGIILSTISGTAFNTSTEAVGTVSVIGDYSTTDVWIGTTFVKTYQFSTPYLKGRSGRGEAAMLTGRYQLRYLTLQYANTGYFRVEAQIKNEATYSYPFTGEILGTSNLDNANILTGAFRTPIFSRNENLILKIVNDSPLPSKILSGDIEASYDDRTTRYSS